MNGYDESTRLAITQVINQRRDVRQGFLADPIPDAVLIRILAAGHAAPSVGLSQPWDFLVLRDRQKRQAVQALVASARADFADSLPDGRRRVFGGLKVEAILETPLNLVVTSDPTRGGRHTLGRHTQPKMAGYSTALAVQNLWLAARAEGVGVGWVSFGDEREVVRLLGIPEHLELVAYLCLGYVEEFATEPELATAGWAKQRPLAWAVHQGEYGQRGLPGAQSIDLLAETLTAIRQRVSVSPMGQSFPAAIAVFAADHPLGDGRAVDRVGDVLAGSAALNERANELGAELCVVDVAVEVPLIPKPGLLPRNVSSLAECEQVRAAIEVGIETARDLVVAGNRQLFAAGLDGGAPGGQGLDHSALVGFILGAAALGVPVGAEGVAATAAQTAARLIADEVSVIV